MAENGNSGGIVGSIGWARTRSTAASIRPRAIFTGSAEVAVPGGDLRYYKLNYQIQHYLPLWRDYTLALNGEFGYADGYSNRSLPFFKNFYAGGIGSVRGFDNGSLGPRDATNESIGGNRRVVGGAELLFPMPGMGQDKSLRIGAFIDFGQVWGTGER